LLVLSAGKTAATTITTGTSVATSLYNSFSGVLNPTADANGWYNSYCSGYRSNIDSTAGLSTFKVGDQVAWEAGYKQYASAAAVTTTAQSPTFTVDFTYTILDSARALTMSAATAVAMIAYTF
jgi:hypothetical protein